MMFRKIQVLIYLMSLIQPPLSADSSFVLSVTEFKTKIFLTAFENEIIVYFLLIAKCHVMNTCSSFKQKYVTKSFISKNLPSECNVQYV